MAKRPWVNPQEVKDYSSSKAVKTRNDTQIQVDITRAEQYVIKHTNNSFSDCDAVPPSIKTAVLILAEAYGHNAAVTAKEVKSETFDDYSYTAESSVVNVANLDLDSLLEDYIVAKPKNGVKMSMRKL